ncbi:MAG: serine/threonine protein kinase [Candidatus Melainabacteria bacterium]|jgi:serine/threonine-protein kinase|uniref:non-specific serine/threonine protein kinase n=1 Tax=Candidatus Obscuribacter phosphatis TaxID=1906157 RepID=A0A8J7PBE2_9BACT|nr:protein kinase [Candidatus Obscuribacter phosphatis]MCA0312371.1 serine/threonine protein kinase [Candidatus Melainabacteria bacterium]OPZ91065.1 MAG: Serine/threonine-protein kinase PrkC [bacterium ADurb.Bin425]
MSQDAAFVVCPTCGKQLPRAAKFCGYDGTDLTLARTGGDVRKICNVCGRFFPGYANFCAFDRSSLEVLKGQPVKITTTPEALPTAPRVANPTAAELGGDTVDVSKYSQPAELTAGPGDFDDDEEADGPYSALIGKTIDGKYLIQNVLGEGGMAVVYKANHVQMERTVVIKVMQGWLLSNKNSIERFERECKLTAKLNHPNIVSVYDVGSIGGKEPYLVMEYIKGEALADKIHSQGALPYATTGNIIVQMCRGLQEAHSMGIIHRDLKPDNVLLQHKSDRPDWVKIVDFGISNLVHGSKRLTKTGRMVGTPEYIAPEQLKDRPIDIRTDLYAIGIMMFEMLTGKVPFEGESAESILMKHLLEDAPPISSVRPDILEVGNPFEPIISKLLKKEPDDRYQTATELRLDVEQALNTVLLKKN